jgi:hypothetical protein
MPVMVKKAVLWRKEIDNRPGMLANTLEPLSEAGADLQVVMGYRYPGGKDTAAIELHPVSGRKSTAAADSRSRPVTDIRPAGPGGQSAGARSRPRESDR